MGMVGPIIRHVVLPFFVFIMVCVGLYFTVRNVDSKDLASALTNLAAVGVLLVDFHLQVYQFSH